MTAEAKKALDLDEFFCDSDAEGHETDPGSYGKPAAQNVSRTTKPQSPGRSLALNPVQVALPADGSRLGVA